MATSAGDILSSYEAADANEIRLGALLAKGGEGTIHAVEDRPELAVKIFHPTLKNLATKLDKVAAMVTSPPQGVIQEDGFTVLAWPTGLVRQNDKPVGYIMPRIDTVNAVEIHTLSNPSSRANPLAGKPTWPTRVSWNHLVKVAANLCVVVDVVHQADAVIGDFQERNVLVADTTRVSLVDCDSIQFTDRSGQVHICAVGRPEFSAPELLAHDLAAHVRGKSSDLFALAIHIHLLLMNGNHPFLRGSWLGDRDQPGPTELAKSGQWAGGRDSRLHTHPLAPPVDFLPASIQDLFTRAFSLGAADPRARPTAGDWYAELMAMTLAECPGGSHQIPADTAECPWCAVEDERQRRRRESQAISAAQQLSSRILPNRVPHPVTARTPPLKATTSAGKAPAKSRPPFRSTTTKRPQKKQASTPFDLSDEFGRSVYRLFLIVAVPFAIFMVIVIASIIIHIIHRL